MGKWEQEQVPEGGKNVAVLLAEFETRLRVKKMHRRELCRAQPVRAPEDRARAQGWDSRPLVKPN